MSRLMAACARVRKHPQQNRSHGFNTDADAITRAIRENGYGFDRAKVLCWEPVGRAGLRH